MTLKEVVVTRSVKMPVYADSYRQMNQTEFALQVEGVCSFYVSGGCEVEYAPSPGATTEEVELYLNGSVYGAILHQRKILPMHGSSFIYKGKGIMICGITGSGKSSLTASFVLIGAEFLTDDVTPVIFEESRPYILALSDRIKLWDHALEQFGLKTDGLRKISPGTDKFYYPVNSANNDRFPLNLVFIIEISENTDVMISRVEGTEKVTALRNEIYRPEYLSVMRENEFLFFHQFVEMSGYTEVIRVTRPSGIKIEDLRRKVTEFIDIRW